GSAKSRRSVTLILAKPCSTAGKYTKPISKGRRFFRRENLRKTLHPEVIIIENKQINQFKFKHMTHSKSILKVTMAIVLAISFTSCGNGQKQGNENVSRAEQTENPSPATNTVSEASVTASLLDAYLGIKNALVKDDQAAAAEYGTALAESTGAFDVETFAASEQQELEEIIEVAKEHGEPYCEK